MTASKVQVLKKDLLFPELSYEIVGSAYDVFNELGFGHQEKYYQKAFAISLTSKKINFKEQVYYALKFKEQTIGRNYFDFLVEDKIVIELKKDNRFSKQHIDQVLGYLRTSGLQLAILINFAKNEVMYKRIINLPDNR